MRKIILLPVLALAIFLASSTAYAGQQDFVFINHSGDKITEFFCSATDNWEENLLPRPLNDGDTLKLTFPEDKTARYWDLKVVLAGGDEFYWAGIDLFSVSQILIDSTGSLHVQ